MRSRMLAGWPGLTLLCSCSSSADAAGHAVVLDLHRLELYCRECRDYVYLQQFDDAVVVSKTAGQCGSMHQGPEIDAAEKLAPLCAALSKMYQALSVHQLRLWCNRSYTAPTVLFNALSCS
jgi:hypothetical protein